MHISQVELASLRRAPRNANRLAPDQYKLLVESIRRIGYVQPILVSVDEDGDHEIIDGHHRVVAMMELGMTNAQAVILAPGEDKRLVAMALNRLRGDTDLAVAGLVIQEMIGDGVDLSDLSISGFDEQECADLLEAVSATDDMTLDDMGDADMPEDEPDSVARPFLLELTFRNRADLTTARKALRNAVGKGGDLADGLLRLAGAQ